MVALISLIFLAAPVSAAPEARSWALWTEPLGTAALIQTQQIYVPIGLELRLSPTLSLSLEGTYENTLERLGFSTGRILGYWASAGMAWRPAADPQLGGFFFQPKLIFHHKTSLVRQSSGPWGTGNGISLGVDMGYGFSVQHFYIALVLGVGYGVCFSNGGTDCQLANPLTNLGSATPVSAWSNFNLHLLRMGAVF